MTLPLAKHLMSENKGSGLIPSKMFLGCWFWGFWRLGSLQKAGGETPQGEIEEGKAAAQSKEDPIF